MMMTAKRKSKRVGDKMITETSAILQYADIAACGKVEQEEEYETPWDNCDGWEHSIVDCPDEMGRDNRESCNAVIHHNRSHHGQMIVCECKDVLDSFAYFRHKGCSKQVAKELVARWKARFIEQLVKWYSDGWEWWYAECVFESPDGTEFRDSCGMIDDYDYAECEVMPDTIRQVCDQLIDAGYTIEGLPDWQAQLRADRRECKIDRLRRNVHLFDVC